VTRSAVLALLLALAGGSCARQLSHPEVVPGQVRAQIADDAPEAFASYVRAYERVLSVGDRLRVANTQACGESVGVHLGWIAWTERDFAGYELRNLARTFLKMGKQPVVVAVAAGGAAARAGVRVGDHVLEVGDYSVATAVQVVRAEHRLTQPGGVVVVERDGAKLTLPVEPVLACRQGFDPVELPQIGAWSWHGNIRVTLRLVQVATDDQLAFALARALALDLLHVDQAAREDRPIPEPRATWLAVELSERAGFSTDDSEALLQLQAVEQPWTVMSTGGRRDGPVKVGEIPRQIIALRMARSRAAPTP
jgi:membrane-associated protease RseP (regulator of RpoE activity)